MTEDLSEADIYAAAPAGGGREPEPREEAPRQEPESPPANLGQLPDQGQQPQGDGRQAVPQDPPRRTMLDDLKEERKRRQEFERQLAERDRAIAERDGAMRQMQAMFGQMQGQGRQPQAPQESPKAPDPFEDPQGFAALQARQVFEQQFGPFAQQFQQREQSLSRQLQGLQRGMAVSQYGAEAAREAEEAFNTAAARGLIDPLEHRRIQSADNPYAAAVEWHRRQRTFEQVGHDPSAWFTSEFQRRAAEDPAFRQQMFELLQGQAQQGQAQGQAVGAHSPAAGKPQPIFTGLGSLTAAPGTSGRDGAPISEADIFGAAPPKMGGRR